MRKIFKLFPVALAVVALASCSSDDLTGGGSNEIKLQSNQLLVVAEELGNGNVTRAGFVEDEIDGKLKLVTVFNNGDKMKIYDDTQNWRPQEWSCVSTTDVQYTQEDGAAGGSTAVFQAPSGVTQYTSGYGIYPATYGTKKFGEFTDEDRKSMKFDFDMFKVFTATIGDANLPAESDYKDGLFCKFPVPMWGVADNTQKMTLKYLTGFLRIDISNVPAITNTTTNPNSRWLLIRSNQALTGQFTAAIADPDADLPSAAPVLAGPTATVSTDALATYPKTGSATGNTDILVNIGDAKGNITVFVPIAAGKDATSAIAHTFNIYMSDATSDLAATTTIDFSGTGKQIAHKGNTTITKNAVRGQFYNVIDDSRNINTDANTPFEVAKAIVAADQSAKRDFTLTFANDIVVKNDDVSPQNYDIDFTGKNTEYLIDGVGAEGYQLKHKVTINAKFVKNGSATTNLTIRTKEGSKDLTVNFLTGTNLQKVTVPATGDLGLNSKLILSSPTGVDVPNVYNASDEKLTLSGKCPYVESTGKFTIDVPYTVGDRVEKVALGGNAKELKIKNGNVQKIELLGGTKAITNDLTISSEGTSYIASFNYKNMPQTAGVDDKHVYFKSKWDGSSFTGSLSSIIKRDGTTTVNDVILTASEFKGYINSGTAAVTILGTYDLDDKTAFGTKATQTVTFTGANEYYKDATAEGFIGKATIQKLKGANGLFADLRAEVKNLIFDDCKIETAAAVTTGTALLAGKISGAVDIHDIVVNANNKVTGKAKSEGVAGVVGIIESNVDFYNIDVEAATIEGYAFVGGIFGKANATTGNVVVNFAPVVSSTGVKNTTWAATNTINNISEAVVKTHKITGTSNSQNYATCGTFFGSFVETSPNTATVNIYKNAYPTSYQNITSGVLTDALWQWSALSGVDHVKYQIHNYFSEFGLCGVNGAATTNMPTSTGSSVKIYAPVTTGSTTTYTARQYQAYYGTTEPVQGTGGKYYMNWVDTNPIED